MKPGKLIAEHMTRQTQEIILRQWRYRTEYRINPELFTESSFANWLDDAADEMVFGMSLNVWGVEEGEDRHEFPSTWWEHVKQRFAPRWFLERWPVKTIEVVARRGIIYPEFASGSGPGVRADRIVVRRWEGRP